jgi:hypothetical protein
MLALGLVLATIASAPSSAASATIEIRLKGDDGTEKMNVFVNGSRVGRTAVLSTNWTVVRYSAKTSPDNVRLKFPNLGGSGSARSVDVDWIQVDGVRYQTEDSTVSTESTCGTGTFSTERLSCKGSLVYPLDGGTKPLPNPNPGADPWETGLAQAIDRAVAAGATSRPTVKTQLPQGHLGPDPAVSLRKVRVGTDIRQRTNKQGEIFYQVMRDLDGVDFEGRRIVVNGHTLTNFRITVPPGLSRSSHLIKGSGTLTNFEVINPGRNSLGSAVKAEKGLLTLDQFAIDQPGGDVLKVGAGASMAATDGYIRLGGNPGDTWHYDGVQLVGKHADRPAIMNAFHRVVIDLNEFGRIHPDGSSPGVNAALYSEAGSTGFTDVGDVLILNPGGSSRAVKFYGRAGNRVTGPIQVIGRQLETVYLHPEDNPGGAKQGPAPTALVIVNSQSTFPFSLLHNDVPGVPNEN